MKTIVVGDIHGHVNSVEAALAHPCNIVFVGDYLDSFSQSVENQILCLKMVLDAAEAEPDRVVGLIGNHELSYLDPAMRCSGYNTKTQRYVDQLKDRMKAVLKPYHWVGDHLISHAGVDEELLLYKKVSLEEYLESGDFNQIGTYRGGYQPVGGLYWNDFNAEMIPINGLKQVVGHSNGKRYHPEVEGVRIKYSDDGTGWTWCVDNLNRKAEVLMIDEEGGAHPVPLLPPDGVDPEWWHSIPDFDEMANE